MADVGRGIWKVLFPSCISSLVSLQPISVVHWKKRAGPSPRRAPVLWSSPLLRASWSSGCRVLQRTQGHLLSLQGEILTKLQHRLLGRSAPRQQAASLVSLSVCLLGVDATLLHRKEKLSILFSKGRRRNKGISLHLSSFGSYFIPSLLRERPSTTDSLAILWLLQFWIMHASSYMVYRLHTPRVKRTILHHLGLLSRV